LLASLALRTYRLGYPRVWGDSAWQRGLRALSVALGVLTVAACYRLDLAGGRRLTGLSAALLVGVSRFDIQWAQEMRTYALAGWLPRCPCGRRPASGGASGGPTQPPMCS